MTLVAENSKVDDPISLPFLVNLVDVDADVTLNDEDTESILTMMPIRKSQAI